MSPGDVIDTLASWQIPTAQNWGDLTQLLVGPKPHTIVLSPDRRFFAVTPTIMKVLLRTAQDKIALGLNSHMAYFTLNASDIPIARSQNELARLLNAPPAHSVVFHDDYFAVKPAILAFASQLFWGFDAEHWSKFRSELRLKLEE